MYEIQEKSLRLHIKLTPKASANRIVGTDKTSPKFLKVMVTPVPENGKANEALVKLLAKTLKVSKSSISIIKGETSRIKILEITGDIDIIIARLNQITHSS